MTAHPAPVEIRRSFSDGGPAIKLLLLWGFTQGPPRFTKAAPTYSCKPAIFYSRCRIVCHDNQSLPVSFNCAIKFSAVPGAKVLRRPHTTDQFPTVTLAVRPPLSIFVKRTNPRRPAPIPLFVFRYDATCVCWSSLALPVPTVNALLQSGVRCARTPDAASAEKGATGRGVNAPARRRVSHSGVGIGHPVPEVCRARGE